MPQVRTNLFRRWKSENDLIIFQDSGCFDPYRVRFRRRGRYTLVGIPNRDFISSVTHAKASPDQGDAEEGIRHRPLQEAKRKSPKCLQFANRVAACVCRKCRGNVTE